jgi:metallo-beta-lactamase family protein
MLNGGRILHHSRNAFLIPTRPCSSSDTRPKRRRPRSSTARKRAHPREIVPVAARIEEIPALSAHADQAELVEWFAKIPAPPERTFLVHGEDAARTALAGRIRDELHYDVSLPLRNQAEDLP